MESISEDTFRFIKDSKIEINDIWNFIKKSSSNIESLEVKENEIVNHFKELHNYLILEEYKLKKPITEDIDNIKNQIEQQLDIFKSLVNIINQYNHIIKPDTDDFNLSSLKINHEEQLFNDDCSSSYTIVNNIKESESLKQFIERNSSLFHNQDYNNDSSYDTLLSVIESHKLIFNQLKLSNSIGNKEIIDNKNYVIKINNESTVLLKEMLANSIQLSGKSKTETTSTITNKPSPAKPMVSSILSTHSSGSHASVINITDINNIKIKEIDFNYNKTDTYSSMLAIDKYVFVFGGFQDREAKGFRGDNRYCKYSIKDGIVHNGAIDNVIYGAQRISVCYDGQDYIYLVGGYHSTYNEVDTWENQERAISLTGKVLTRIDRYNIRTLKFEQYHSNPKFKDTMLISIYLNGWIYSFQRGTESKLFLFNVKTKTTGERILAIPNVAFIAACTDGRGNIFIHSAKTFYRYNVLTAQVEALKPAAKNFTCYLSMVYIESNSASNSGGMVIMGGANFGNYFYSNETKQWTQILLDDKFDRRWCGSQIY